MQSRAGWAGRSARACSPTWTAAAFGWGIACAPFNGGITPRLLDGALAGLARGRRVDRADTYVAWVPGAFELPLAAEPLAVTGGGRRGGLPRARSSGATPATSTSWPASARSGCATGGPSTPGVPVVFGVLTTDTVDQALSPVAARTQTNKGREAAVTALQMAVPCSACVPACRHADARVVPRPRGRDCSDWSCPRGRSRGDPRALRRRRPRASYRALRGRLPGHHRRPPGRRGPDPAAPGDPASTSPRASSTSASPAATGWRSRAPRSCRSASCPTPRSRANPIRIVLAVAEDSPVTLDRGPGAPGAGRSGRDRVPRADPAVLEEHGVDAEIRLSYGATEAKVPDIADCVVEITETGRALRAAGLRIIDTLLVSHTELIANPASAADPEKRRAMDQL